MTRALVSFATLVAFGLAFPVRAGDAVTWPGFYDQRTLLRTKALVEPSIRENWRNVIWERLQPDEQRALRGVDFAFDLEDPTHPFNFYAKDGVVHMPASSVLMLGDLLGSWLWLDRNRYSTDTVNEYVAILKYNWGSSALRRLSYRPLDVLGVPADVREDPAIAEQYATLSSNILFFLLCHELGHILYGHVGIEAKDTASSAWSIRQEQEADAFALDIMARVGAVPFGVPMYFVLASSWDVALGDSKHHAPRTHPLNSERVRAIATTLRQRSHTFARAFRNPATAEDQVRSIADDLVRCDPPHLCVVGALESDGVRRLWQRVGLEARLDDLKPRAKGSSIGRRASRSDGGQLFNGTYVGKWIDAKGSVFDVRMDLQRNGDTVVGSWTFGPYSARLDGMVQEQRLYFDWKWGQDYFGRGELHATPEGRIAGTWGHTGQNVGGGTWSLARR